MNNMETRMIIAQRIDLDSVQRIVNYLEKDMGKI